MVLESIYRKQKCIIRRVLLPYSSLQNIAATIIVYLGSLTFYRPFLHPLTQYSGPRFAAIPKYYEAYHKIVQNGQYRFKIAEMHKKYGVNSQKYRTSHSNT